MKQALQLKISQNLTMTPQLQQAIRLLQLSTLELETEIQQTLESNPMLEQDEDGSDAGEQRQESLNNDPEAGVSDAVQAETMPDELPVDSSWDDVFDNGATSYSSPEGSARDPAETFTVSGESLHDHLTWQVEMSHFSDTDRLIAHAVIDAIDEDGYLTTGTEHILRLLDSSAGIEADEIEAVIHRIQQFDPIGVGARDLRESLLLQLEQFDAGTTPWLREARLLVRDHFSLLSNRDFSRLAGKLHLSMEELQQVVGLIQSLNPRPGASYNNTEPEYIIPDVYVFRKDGVWQVELNSESIPKLRINSLYASMIKRGNNSRDNNYLRDNLQEARWFLKSLQSRHETLLKVARCIVERQHAFLDHGEEAMKPMVLRSIAEAIDMHESTVSRVTTRKYMHTPRGIFEFKYFFSSHVSTENGGECSATAIRAIIKKLVAAENPAKPLSDSKMASVLAEQGINVARRTIAKYRESLSISPSNERKRLN